jgi:hypothetical protein
MSGQTYVPYRGWKIEVHVTPARTYALGGIARRYRVSWTISKPGGREGEFASFPEQFDFLSEQDAFAYGENRAHTYIDSMLSTPSKSRTLGESSAPSAHL